jgi:hypothetical protein
MGELLVYRMEDRQHRGPFNTDFLTRDPQRAYDMWHEVPWAEVDTLFGGLASLDADHPHHLDDVLHVGPNFDGYASDVYGEYPIAGHWLVGCTDLGQFYHWFPPNALPDFAHCGMLLHVYECPNDAVKFGQWQVMFDPDRSKIVKSEPLTKLKGTETSLPLAA